MDDVFLIHSPDDIICYLRSSGVQGILESDERVMRIVDYDFQQALPYLEQALSSFEVWEQVQEAECDVDVASMHLECNRES